MEKQVVNKFILNCLFLTMMKNPQKGCCLKDDEIYLLISSFRVVLSTCPFAVISYIPVGVSLS